MIERSSGLKYQFTLPIEEQVLQRNRTITTYYAQLYLAEPRLYKWAGMAAFASFHIGKRLELWDWGNKGIKPFELTCKKVNRTVEDDFQVIRVLNNEIFSKIGSLHLAFAQMEYESFKQILEESGRHKIIVEAFEKLNRIRNNNDTNSDRDVWEANEAILWHEQSLVVQPLFNKLTDFFSTTMSLLAGFDYKVNHKKTGPILRSKFFLFMFIKGRSVMRKFQIIPDVTDLDQRWFWIERDILPKWKKMERSKKKIWTEITYLSKLEERNLILTR